MKIKEIMKHFNHLSVRGDDNKEISTLSSPDDVEEGSIVCIDNNKYIEDALESKASCLVLKEKPKTPTDKTIIIVENVKETFYKLLEIMFENNVIEYGTIKSSAKIEKSSNVSKTAFIGEYVVIGKNSTIGENTVIDSAVIIGNNVVIGDNCHIYANVVLHDSTIIKNNVIIASNSVIGTDGFGYHVVNGTHKKIPQRGNVIIENDCELGASVMIDRATLGSTIIRKGSKIDNLVHIAHNCDIGANAIIVAQTGIAGSTTLGHHCVLAGQVGVADHVTIGDQVIIAAQSGIMPNAKIESNKILFGSPAQDLNREKLSIIAYKKLPELIELIEEKFAVKIKAKKNI